MVVIFESHPIQYRAPLYRELQAECPDRFLVVYATDCSVRGYNDTGFGVKVTWDEPLLSGYPNRVLNNERGVPLSGPRSLHGRGIWSLLKTLKPEAVCLTGFLYEFEFVAYISCKLLGIPVWMRMETQDESFARARWKTSVRSLIYRVLYKGMSRAFYFGELNREHLLGHGVPADILTRTPFGVVDRWDGIEAPAADARGREWRAKNGIPVDAWVVGFFGKLIGKKNPALLVAACAALPDALKSRLHLIFVGSGQDEAALREQAGRLGLKAHFFGFINQLMLPDYYLGADVLVLPSRRMGETWGLVINEALLAGCSVVMSDAVGCHPEFGHWERVRVIPSEDTSACARALSELSVFPREFEWCRERMRNYSISTAAKGIATCIKSL